MPRQKQGPGPKPVVLPRSAAAGVEVAQQVLAETQGAVLPLVPYLDTLCWIFIALALAGTAVAICARLDDCCEGFIPTTVRQ